MADRKNETPADIAAEMRRNMNPNGTAECQYLESDICTLADRIEAAWKRETGAAWNRGYDHAKRDFRPLADELARRQPVGNSAALREVLVKVKKSIDGIGASSLDCDPVILMASLTQVCARLSASIEAALSKPPRNCDLFSGYAEAENYWLEHVECEEVNGCFDVWLFELAEQKGETDGR